MTIKRPALKYFGGKWRMAPWIISYFPEHTHYIEPCFGAGSVLLRKEQVELETVNDLNGRLVNFFRALRDDPDELIGKIDLTPWAQDEYKLAQIESDDPVEDARRFFFMSWMSVNGGPLPTGFRISKTRGSRGSIPPTDGINHALNAITKRLRTVQVMNIDAIAFIRKFNEDENALIYFDPPYVKSTRTSKGYGVFDDFDDLHKQAAELLNQSKSKVVVSGYMSNEYDALYKGWNRVDKQAYVQNNQKRIESLWMNY